MKHYSICDKQTKKSENDILEIHSIGYGNSFSTGEGNSSFFIVDSKSKKTLLLDCGSLVYKSLREKELSNKIDWIFITHTHEDHIGSLSTLIYENFFIHNRKLKIVCNSNIFYDVNNYLKRVCHHKDEQYEICVPNTSLLFEEEFIKDFPSFNLNTFITTGKHFPDLPSSGLSLKLKDIDFEVVFSGDLGVSVVDELELDKSSLEQGKFLVFQDAGTFKFPDTHLIPPHAYFENCDHPNSFLYHHMEHEVDIINNTCRLAKSIGTAANNNQHFVIKKQ